MIEDLNYAQQQRMHFIDCMVDHFGFIQRKHIQDFFGLGSSQPTKDIKLYTERWPENLSYNVRAKAWTKTDNFKRINHCVK